MVENNDNYTPPAMSSKRQRVWQEDPNMSQNPNHQYPRHPHNQHPHHAPHPNNSHNPPPHNPPHNQPHNPESYPNYEDYGRHEGMNQGPPPSSNNPNNHGMRRDDMGMPMHSNHMSHTPAPQSSMNGANPNASNSGGNPPGPTGPALMMLSHPSDQSFLTEEEYVVCANVEIFSSTPNDVQEPYNERPNGPYTFTAATHGQLGLRSIHEANAPYATLYPSSLESIPACLEILVEEHFLKSNRIPLEVRDAAMNLSKHWKRRREGEEDKNIMRLSMDSLPRRTGMSNMYPAKSGVRFEMMPHDPWTNPQNMNGSYDERGMHPQPPPHGHPNYPPYPETPGRKAGTSQHPSNGSRMGAPPPSQHGHMYPHAPQSTSPAYNQHYGPPPPGSHPSSMEGSGYPPHPNHPPPRYDMGGYNGRYYGHNPYQYPPPPYHGHPPHHGHGNMWHPVMYPPHEGQHGHGPPPEHPHGQNHRNNRSSSPPPHPPSDAATQAAIGYLKTNKITSTSAELVLPEDKALLTDYFYHLMEQLQLCFFSEGDRKTRGGKRENVKIGFGGIECKHCATVVGHTLSRKFFWSNVDRLANSFAEIPSHVLKCRNCPSEIKSALAQLKLRHPEQMAQLPRGSQKVYFRRMWRRMHTERGKGSGVRPELKPIPLSGEGVALSIPEDADWLSDLDCFVRKNLEAFCATEEDVQSAQSDRKYPIHVGQVGIRCVHCARKGMARGNAVSFPYSISGIYESVREFQRLHLDCCPNLSDPMKEEMKNLKTSTSLSSVLRRYYVLAAKALGMRDTQDGIRSGGELIPIGNFADMIHSRDEEDVRDAKRRRDD